MAHSARELQVKRPSHGARLRQDDGERDPQKVSRVYDLTHPTAPG